MQQFVITHSEGNRLVFPAVIALNPQNILTAEEKTNGCDILYEQTSSEKIDLILYRVANKKSQITGLYGVNLVDVSVYDKATGATRTIAVKGDIVSYTEEAAFRSNTGSVNCRKIYLESLKYSDSFCVSNTTEYILENLGSNKIQKPQLLSASTTEEGDIVLLEFDIEMGNPNGFKEDFTLKVNETSVPIATIALEFGAKIFSVYPEYQINESDTVTISIAKGNIASAEGVLLEAVTVHPVTVNRVGTTYYVANDGSDAATGLTDDLAWQTISKINGETFSVGDSILFKRGDSWEGTITVSDSGAESLPITYGAYGIGAKPKIYGSGVITGWTLHSGNIWKATVASEITQLFVNGERMRVARHSNTGVDVITSITSQTVFTCNELDDQIDYTGAVVLLRPTAWFDYMRAVTSSSGNTLTIASAAGRDIAAGQKFLIMNKLEFLNEAGEWYFDSNTNTVYLWTPNGDSPANYEVRGSTVERGFYANGKSYVTVRDLHFLQHKNTGIEFRLSNYFTAKNNIIENPERDGIFEESGSEHATIEGNIITGANSRGIYTYSKYSLFKDNVIDNIAEFDKIGLSGAGGDKGNGIDVSGEGNVIEYNRVTNTGYNGIFWRFPTTVQYNFVQNACLWKNDGGGIYCGNANGIGSVVQNNIVDNVVGDYTTGGTTQRSISNGIYFDEGTVGMEMKNNTVINSGSSGIFLHRPNNHDVQNNTVFFARNGFSASNTLIDDFAGQTQFKNNLVIIGSDTDDYLSRPVLSGINSNIVELVDYDNNHYINGFSSDLVFRIPTGNTYLDFSDWQTHISGDANTVYDGTNFLTNETQKVIYNDTKIAKTFYLNNATGVKDENGDAITTSFILQPFTSQYVRGVNIDCILDYEDSTAPVITSFTLAETSESFIIEPLTLAATGEATAYILTETDSEPNLYDSGWSLTPSFNVAPQISGSKTLYIWARDAAGNISSPASATTTIDVELQYEDIGYNTVYGSTSATTVRRGMPITMTEDGLITSISFYSQETTGTCIVGVYADSSGPTTRLGISEVTNVNGEAGWNTVDLITPVFVGEGTKVWIAFTSSGGGSKFEAGTPYRAQATSGDYSDGLPDPFGTSNQVTNRISVYCTYIKL